MQVSKQKTLLITGATGFLGKRAMELLGDAWDTVGLARNGRGPGILKADLTDPESLSRLDTGSIDTVIHAAASVHTTNEPRHIKELFDVNVTGLVNLLDFAASRKVRRVVHCSSVSVYGGFHRRRLDEQSPRMPDSYYGISKLAAEEILIDFCRANGIGYAVLRFSSIYGPGQRLKSVIPVFIEQATTRGRITVFGAGDRTQDFIYVDDAVRALELAARSRKNVVCNVGSGKRTTMKQLAGHVNRVFADGRGEAIFLKDTQDDGSRYRLNISRAEAKLGFKAAFSLRRGLNIIKASM